MTNYDEQPRIHILFCIFVSAGLIFTACETDPPMEPELTELVVELDGGVDLTAVRQQVPLYWTKPHNTAAGLLFFDHLWEAMSQSYGGFTVAPINWDAARFQYRPKVALATSSGEFFGIVQHMIQSLHDGHTVMANNLICGHRNPAFPSLAFDFQNRPPLFIKEDHLSAIGACVTPKENGQLLVYKVAPGHPAGLKPGDVLLGYDGASWQTIVDAVDAAMLPTCGRTGTDPFSVWSKKMGAIGNNAHLFYQLYFHRRHNAKIETIQTQDLLDFNSPIVCNGQLPMDGVAYPCDTAQECTDLWENHENGVSYGKIAGTNIGYIYVYNWVSAGAWDFESAVRELWDTDGLIIDQRFGVGGNPSAWHGGMALLFKNYYEDLIRYGQGKNGAAGLKVPQNGINNQAFYGVDSVFMQSAAVNAHQDFFCIPGDSRTFYDRPIAVLQGPQMGSAGDVFPYLMSYHPKVRRFGRATDGRFGIPYELELKVSFWGEEPGNFREYELKATQDLLRDSEGNVLQGTGLEPDEWIWLTAEDVANGQDTVVNAALEWIQNSE